MPMFVFLLAISGFAATPDPLENVLDDAPVVDRTRTPVPGIRPLFDMDLGAGLAIYADDYALGTRLVGGAGYTPALSNGRLRGHVELGWSRAAARGDVAVETIADGVDWRLGIHRWDLGVGAGWSLRGDGSDMDVEFFATPRLAVVHARGKSSTAGVELGRGQETMVRPGMTFGAGVVAPLDRAEISGQLGVTILNYESVLSGQTVVASPSLLIRYRPILRERT